VWNFYECEKISVSIWRNRGKFCNFETQNRRDIIVRRWGDFITLAIRHISAESDGTAPLPLRLDAPMFVAVIAEKLNRLCPVCNICQPLRDDTYREDIKDEYSHDERA